MTNDPTWATVDRFIADTILAEDALLKEALAQSQQGSLPPIQVPPAHGKLLHILARGCGAIRILEVGTLGGYSTIWLARALPAGGKLITLEIESRHAAIAQANLARAGVADRVEIRVGPASDLLPALAQQNAGPFDFSFIDANKDASSEYFDWAVKLSRTGSLIVVDNVVRNGTLADATNTEKYNSGVRCLHDSVARDPRVSATTIQTVCEKGYDGFLIAVVN